MGEGIGGGGGGGHTQTQTHMHTHNLPSSVATALRRFEVLHGALAREFVLPLCSPKEVRKRRPLTKCYRHLTYLLAALLQ